MLGRQGGVSGETCRSRARPAGVRALIIPQSVPESSWGMEGSESKAGLREGGQEGGGVRVDQRHAQHRECPRGLSKMQTPTTESRRKLPVCTDRMVSALGNGVKGGLCGLLRGGRAVRPIHSLACCETLPMWKLPTGEPYTGKSEVRFGGRGGETLPDPYHAKSPASHSIRWPVA